MALSKELRMTIRTLAKRGCSRRAIARGARVSERQVRYELRRDEGRGDGRAKVGRASSLEEVIREWCGGFKEERALNATALHEHLVAEHGYVGSLRSVQRYLQRRLGPGRVRARRRVETPPGAQSQADWAHAPRMRVGGRQGVYGFALRLSYSRKKRGGVVGAEGHAVVVVGSRAGVFAGEGGDGDGADRQREDGDGAGCGSLGGCEPGVSAVCEGGAVPH